MARSINMVKNDNFVRIEKTWLEKDGHNNGIKFIDIYGELGFGFYIYCRMNEQAYDDSSKIAIAEFLDMFGFTNSKTRRNKRKELMIIINLMQENGLIKFYHDFTLEDVVPFDVDVKDNIIRYCKVIKFKDVDGIKDAYFIKVTKQEIGKILSAKSSKLELLIHYLTIIGFEDTVKKVAFPQIETIINASNISNKSCIKYSELLMEMEVMYYANAGMKYNPEDKSYQAFSNTYGRWCNKSYVDSYIKYILSNEKDKICNTTEVKQKRSHRSRGLAVRINNLEKMKNRTPDEDQELIDKQIEHINIRKIIEKDKDKDYAGIYPKSMNKHK